MMDRFNELVDGPFLVPDGRLMTHISELDFVNQGLVLNAHEAFEKLDFPGALLALRLFVRSREGKPSSCPSSNGLRQMG